MSKKVISFQDLDVYQRLYSAMLLVIRDVLPIMPPEEKFDLARQMRKSCKAPLAIISEGYAHKNYKKDWQKYINAAIGECNEMIVHLSQYRDIYATTANMDLIHKLIESYDISGKQLFRLGESWVKGATPPPARYPDPYHTTQPQPSERIDA